MEDKTKKTRIMVFGTFDGLHQGHINFFKQAKKLAKNPYLIVSIARDTNVRKIKKSFPRFTEKKRVILVKKLKIADQVVLSGITNHIPHIIKERPDIIALGYDQKNYIKNLAKDLKARGLSVRIVRMKPFKAHIFKNRLIRMKLEV